VEFQKASLGKRGYDEEQVDALLDEATREMIRLLEENDLLQRRLDVEPPPDGPPPRAEFSMVAAELDRARRACDQAEVNARELERRLDEARRSAAQRRDRGGDPNPERVLAMAQRTADEHLHEADAESHAVIAEARERCQRMTREARQMVDDIEQTARRHEDEAVADLVTKRTALLKQIDELTEFAENYRVALEVHVAQQGRLLEDQAAF
jgi:DivIVA domain-containing protein